MDHRKSVKCFKVPNKLYPTIVTVVPNKQLAKKKGKFEIYAI
jgi:hypothetical protein